MEKEVKYKEDPDQKTPEELFDVPLREILSRKKAKIYFINGIMNTLPDACKLGKVLQDRIQEQIGKLVPVTTLYSNFLSPDEVKNFGRAMAGSFRESVTSVNKIVKNATNFINDHSTTVLIILVVIIVGFIAWCLCDWDSINSLICSLYTLLKSLMSTLKNAPAAISAAIFNSLPSVFGENGTLNEIAEEVAKRLFQQTEEFSRIEGPIIFFAHSFGSLVACALLQLFLSGKEVYVVAFGSPANLSKLRHDRIYSYGFEDDPVTKLESNPPKNWEDLSPFFSSKEHEFIRYCSSIRIISDGGNNHSDDNHNNNAE